MTKREVANLCCRVLAIYALLQALPSLGLIIGLVHPLFDSPPWTGNEILQQFIVASQPVLLLAAATVLWKKSWHIAALMVGYTIQDRADEPDVKAARPAAADIHIIAFSTVGLFVLIETIPEVIAYAFHYAAASATGDPMLQTKVQFWGAERVIYMALRFAIGLWLILGARGLVSALRRLRYAGLESAERPHASSSSSDEHSPVR